MERIIVLGASTKPHRYSYKAALRLQEEGHTVFLLGKTKGTIADMEILTGRPEFKKIDTITMYIRPEHQEAMYSYLIRIKPKRIIFNPGTENPEFLLLLEKQGIATENACTLVLLSTGAF